MVNVVFGCGLFEDFVVACRGYRILNYGKLENTKIIGMKKGTGEG